LDEIHQENASIIREGRWSSVSRLNMQDMDINVGLVRYTVTPVMLNSKCIGAVVSGDVLNGKTYLLEDTVETLGTGFGAVYVKDEKSDDYYSVIELLPSTGYVVKFIAEINMADIQTIGNSLFSKDWSDSEVFVHEFSTEYGTFTVAAMRGRSLSRGETSDETSPSSAIIIRGYSSEISDESFFRTLVVTLALAVGFLVTDVICTVIAIRTFVDPLEKLILYVKLRQYDKYGDLMEKIMKTNKFFYQVVGFVAVSITLLSMIVVHNKNEMGEIFNSLSSSGTQMNGMQFGFLFKMNNKGALGIRTIDNLQRLLNNTAEPTDYDLTVQGLQFERNLRSVEFCTLVSANFTILAGANNDRRGQVFDPSGVVSTASQLNRRVAVVTTMEYDEFLLEGAPRFM
jgi:hypothetical protein